MNIVESKQNNGYKLLNILSYLQSVILFGDDFEKSLDYVLHCIGAGVRLLIKTEQRGNQSRILHRVQSVHNHFECFRSMWTEILIIEVEKRVVNSLQ